MKMIIINIAVCIMIITACEVNITSPIIPYDLITETLSGGVKLNDAELSRLNGIYKLNGANSDFGDMAVIKSYKNTISMFFKKNASFAIADARRINQEIIIAGYWRFAQGGTCGFIKLVIDSVNTNKLLADSEYTNLKITGYYDFDGKKSIDLEYNKAISKDDFTIIGHRGGGRNSDRHPASENSLEMIAYSEKLGANAVEIDVQFTSDNVPILFHDIYMSKRLVKEDYFIGKVSDYSFKQLRAFCSLKNGEKIPTLEEALEFIIDSTNHKLIWLDVKSTNTIAKINEYCIKYKSIAEGKKRNIEILIGIPTIELYNELISLQNYKDIPTICELDENYVTSANSLAWGPRWSLGYLTDRVLNIHAINKRVYVWTLDEPQFIRRYIDKSYFDGILTNYPTVVAYEYYTN